jgi:hypothetical protein
VIYWLVCTAVLQRSAATLCSRHGGWLYYFVLLVQAFLAAYLLVCDSNFAERVGWLVTAALQLGGGGGCRLRWSQCWVLVRLWLLCGGCCMCCGVKV